MKAYTIEDALRKLADPNSEGCVGSPCYVRKAKAGSVTTRQCCSCFSEMDRTARKFLEKIGARLQTQQATIAELLVDVAEEESAKAHLKALVNAIRSGGDVAALLDAEESQTASRLRDALQSENYWRQRAIKAEAKLADQSAETSRLADRLKVITAAVTDAVATDEDEELEPDRFDDWEDEGESW